MVLTKSQNNLHSSIPQHRTCILPAIRAFPSRVWAARSGVDIGRPIIFLVAASENDPLAPRGI
jgi:hypothetical protein